MIRFTDCICEGEFPELKPLAAFDRYFSYSGREYRAINFFELHQQPAVAVERVQADQNILLTALKVMSLFTLVVPLIMLIGKLICRSQYAFHVQGPHLSELGPAKEGMVREVISPEEQRKIVQAKELLESFDNATFGKIHALGIKTQAALAEVVKLSVSKLPWTTTELPIKDFGITDQAALAEIAKLCAEKDVWATVEHIQNFGIEDEAVRIEIAKICAMKGGDLVACFIENFKICDQEALIEIALLCEDNVPGSVAKHIKNFGIANQQRLVQIAMLSAEKAAWETTLHIKEFGISDQTALVQIAKLCAEKNPESLAEHIQNFKIRDQEALVEIYKICAKQIPDKMEKYIQNFGISELSHKDEQAPGADGSLKVEDGKFV